MVRKSLVVAGAAVLLAGCSTTVAGSPVADPSGVPKPDTGSYATAPRTIAPMSEKVQIAAEAFRMVAIIPLATEIDGAIRFGGRPSVGRMSSTIKSVYGDGVGAALAGHEVGAYTSGTDKSPSSDSTALGNQLITGLFRFKDDAAARAAVADPAVMGEDKGFGSGKPIPKTPVTVPGYAEARAYSKASSGSTSVVGLLASGRFVLAAYTRGPVEQVKKFFDLQLPALKGFAPTPVEKFSTLTRDHDDMLRYTLAEQSPTVFEAALPARTLVSGQTDVTAAQKDFADTGVDYIAVAGNIVYRAQDAGAAKTLSDRFITEIQTLRKGANVETVTGVPGGRCLKTPKYPGATSTNSYCVVPVGRYLAEVSDAQDTRAKQALGASYLILQGAK
ncbi:hypothetical protein TPB0596_40460 [Tsukamurella pulmonis]|uniref:DUF7373 family lipoprotein n=1 Tax=Tsukamurella pulmonis TaxID=47312 RepID=UPI001EDFDD5D|nr:hypothetical protein [Tsukamurella pulmonis]BDD84283.1 hypothetical protein TPB0596_40460 [Tsukamurella pulmonis]